MKKHNYLRLFYLRIVLFVMCLGLLSRRLSNYIPDIIDLYLGDLLWALMIYFIIRMVFTNKSVKQVAFYGVFFCFLIEFSQLYHSTWIDIIRRTTIGGLVLGYGFLWSDLIAYLLGTITGALIDRRLKWKKIF